jgi:hypothetical protein
MGLVVVIWCYPCPPCSYFSRTYCDLWYHGWALINFHCVRASISYQISDRKCTTSRSLLHTSAYVRAYVSICRVRFLFRRFLILEHAMYSDFSFAQGWKCCSKASSKAWLVVMLCLDPRPWVMCLGATNAWDLQPRVHATWGLKLPVHAALSY